MAYSLGIMQGRLTEPKGRGIQFFPFDNWAEEFAIAAELGLNEIEFIFDFDNYQDNPLWSETGLAKIQALAQEHGVKVNHICADFFMRRPFFRVDEVTRQENVAILKQLIIAAHTINAHNVEIPLVDKSSIKTDEEQVTLIASLREVLPTAEQYNITLGLETDLAPQPFFQLLNECNSPLIKANYDTGNSSGLGYNHREELEEFGSYIENVHIKDRLLGGTTVTLGTGNANFDQFFQALKPLNYQGSFILQVARGEEGEEKEAIKAYMSFVQDYIKKYLV